MELPWASLTVVVPLAAALVCGLVSAKKAAAVGLVGSAATLIAAGALVAHVAGHGPFGESPGGWGAPLGIELYVDGFSAAMVAMVAVVGICVSLFSLGYFRDTEAVDDADTGHHQGYFWSLWLVVWASLNAIFVSSDLFNIYVGMEVMGLASVALVALAGPGALPAAMRYLFVTLAGSFLYLLGVALLYGGWGVVDIQLLGESVHPGVVSYTALVVMSAGLALKTALLPLHFWLPSAHANAPSPVSAVLSGLVVKASFFVVVRLWIDVFSVLDTTAIAWALAIAGAVAVVWGSIQAFRQRRLKMLVAYSTVAQVGYLFVAFGPTVVDEATGAAITAAVYFAVAHGCAKGAMFLAAGGVASALQTDEFSRLRGRAGDVIVPLVAFGLAGLALVGLIPLGVYPGKELLIDATARAGMPLAAVLITGGGVLVVAYVLKVFFIAVFADGGEPDPAARAIPLTINAAAVALAVVALAIGAVSEPLFDLLRVGRAFD